MAIYVLKHVAHDSKDVLRIFRVLCGDIIHETKNTSSPVREPVTSRNEAFSGYRTCRMSLTNELSLMLLEWPFKHKSGGKCDLDSAQSSPAHEKV